MKPPCSLRVITAAGIAVTLGMFALTGCNTVQSVKPSITNTNGDLGGSLEIVFKTAAGATQTVTVPRVATSRGYDAAGNFVSSGTLKGYAIEAYEADQLSGEVAKRRGLNDPDRATVELVINRLARAGAKTILR